MLELVGFELEGSIADQGRDSGAGLELGNDIDCDSPELTSVDNECAQNVPTQPLD